MGTVADIRSKISEIYSLEQLSGGKTAVHRLHPGAKLIVTVCYIVTVISFNRFDFARMAPFVFYPILMMGLSETPYGIVLKRVLLALPFVLFAGISNLIFDRETAFTIGSLAVSTGVVSFFSLIFRTVLTVSAVFVLVAVTPFVSITDQLRRWHLPEVLVMLLELTYRYIGALLEEASNMYTAYSLRHTHAKGLELRHMGSFIGHLLLKSFDRADRIYSAMKCRGYGRTRYRSHHHRWRRQDVVFTVVCVSLFALFRAVDVTRLWSILL